MATWLRTGKYKDGYPLAEYLQCSPSMTRKIVKELKAAGLVYHDFGPAIVKAEDVDAFLERRKRNEVISD